MARKLRIAVIGVGAIALSAHLPAYTGFNQIAEVCAVVSRTKESAKHAADVFGIRSWFTNVRQMLESIQPDVVSICTPNASHAELVQLCLEYGAHVLCEKPLTLSGKKAEELYALAQKEKRILMTAQTVRFTPFVQRAKLLLDQGLLGPLYLLEIDRIRNRGVPAWGAFQRKESNLGGAMCDIGVHQLDAVLWLAGNPRPVSAHSFLASPLSLSGQPVCTDMAKNGAFYGTKPASPDMDVEEFAAGSLLLEGGKMLLFKTAWAAHLPDRTCLTLLGSNGGLELPSLALHGVQADIPEWEDEFASHPFSGHWHIIRNLLFAATGRAEPVITPEQTICVSRALELIYHPQEFGSEGTSASKS